jgi:hypothetical protein
MAKDFKYVVLASFWPYKDKEDVFAHDLDTVVRQIVDAGAIPVVFEDNPYFTTDLSQCILFKKRGWASPEKNCNIPRSFVSEAQMSMDKVIDSIKTKYPQTIVIDPKLVMCNATECATYLGNIALYKDANHINSKASALLADRYLANQGNPFAQKTFLASFK